MVRDGTGIIKTLRLHKHYLQLHGGVDIHDLIAFGRNILFFGDIIVLRRIACILIHEIHIVVIVIVVVGHAHHTFDLIEHTHL